MMSDEPNRKMDDLLKAYAKKRQAEAGKPELHPATRKLLQDEVRRTFGTGAAKDEQGTSIWKLYWPKFALAAAACVLAGGLFLALQKQEQRIELAEFRADKELKETSVREPQSRVTYFDDKSADAKADRQSLPAAPSASAPASEMATARRKLESGREVVIGAEAAKALAKKDADLEGAIVADTASPPARSSYSRTMAFVQTSRPTEADKEHANVLSNFEVELSGDRLRIIDADGSVYEGKIVNDGTVAALEESADSETAEVKQRRLGVPESFSFQVAGTNRTLNEPLTFSGRFFVESKTRQPAGAVVSSDAMSEAPSPGRPARAETFSTSSNVQPEPGRVQGRLVFKGTNEVKIDAVWSNR